MRQRSLAEGKYGLIRNATRKDFEDEIRLFYIVLELPRYRYRIWGFSSQIVRMRNRRFAYFEVSRNGFRSCVCFSKPFDNNYLFAPFGDRMTFLAFTVVSGAKT